MRELKFRAWHKSEKYMAYQGDPDLESLSSFMFHYGDDIIMQSTGFCDKNGLEIYEGDILSEWNEIDGKQVQSFMQVYFCEESGSWRIDLSFEQNKSMGYLLSQELNDSDYEISGNIYENPELLKKH